MNGNTINHQQAKVIKKLFSAVNEALQTLENFAGMTLPVYTSVELANELEAAKEEALSSGLTKTAEGVLAKGEVS